MTMRALDRTLAIAMLAAVLSAAACSEGDRAAKMAAGGDLAAVGDVSADGGDLAAVGDAAADAAGLTAGNGGGPPNIVFVLTDDLAWNLVQYMPNVKRMQARGRTFTRYFVTDSLCCPSRSSIFTGKFPHDTQVFTNSGSSGGYAQFEKVGNPTQTFAATLSGVAYKTAMMGKYLNGYEPTLNQADPGWSEWDVAGEGYPELNYQLNQNGRVVPYGNAPADYLVDVQSGLATRFIESQGNRPFLIEIATFAPHAPFTPAPRYVGQYHEMAPRTAAFAKTNVNPPRWLAAQKPLSAADIVQLDTDFNKRVEAVQAVDDLIGQLFVTLKAQGIDQNTYVIFSSDNGFHMGEHMMFEGKQSAFDSDIHVPLVVVGPGIPAGTVDPHIVQNIDLCPTFAELAGTPPPANVDGHSLVALLRGHPVSDWRNVALVEHHGPEVEARDLDDPDNDGWTPEAVDGGAAAGHGPIPSTYEAIRMETSLFVSYADGETEYYDLTSDPGERTNTVGTLSKAQVTSLEGTISAIQSCHGSQPCWTAQHR
jgi:N-acetylglucosamine-6-sulfatase